MRAHIVTALVTFLFTLSVRAVDFDSRAWTGPGISVFVSGAQRGARTKNGGDETRFNPYAVALGFERATLGWSSGFSMSYETGHLKYASPGEYARILDRTLGFTLFGTRHFGDGFYGRGSIFLGFASQKLKGGYDGAGLRTANGQDRSIRLGAGLEFGKIYEIGSGLRFTPHAGFDYSLVPGSDISYKRAGDSGSLAWPHQNRYEIPLGLTLAKDFFLGEWIFTPSVDATLISAVGHIKDVNRSARPGFMSHTGSGWKTYGVGAGHWGGRLTAGVTMAKSRRFDLDLNYMYERHKNYRDHRVAVSAGVLF
ncbi:MAG: autotransporter outer membrane beta-barrel domain-containing protein [Planctomycetota bacterium]|nr:autotransporter outer membrane beta-barrel domain-containing protein [Planctomycetota bacterium]